MTPKARKHTRDRRLAELASRQHGVVGRWQLIEIGRGDEAIKTRLRAGRLHPLHRGAYAVGHRILTKRGKWLAAVLAMGPGAFLSHDSAAALWGLAGDRGKVHVTAPRGRQILPGRSGIKVHRCKFTPEEVTTRDGIRVSTVARTIFDCAEWNPNHQVKQAWTEADRLHLLDLDAVAAVYERGRGRRRARKRIKPLLTAERRYVEDTASPLEDRFVEFCVAHDLPKPQAGVLIGEDLVDFLWPAARLIVELDGWGFHAHREAFETDRSRDLDHLTAGYRTIRVTFRRLTEEPERLAAQIRALLS